MQISSISFMGERKYRRIGKRPVIKVQPQRVVPEKQIELSTPKNYEIYMRPFLKGSSIIQEINNSSRRKISENTKKPNVDADDENCGLPEEINKEIDKALGKEAKTEKGKTIKRILSIIYAVLIMGGSILGTSYGKDMMAYVPESAVVDFDSNKDTIEKIADRYNIDPEIIKYVNGIDEDYDINTASKLIIPSKYSYLKDASEDIMDTLYKNKNIDDDTYDLYEKKIDALEKKQAVQNEIAELYTDGQMVYIKLKDFNKHPELIEKYSGTNLTDDTIDKLFDIKKGELGKYNTFSNSDNKSNAGFVVHAGSILKVPKSAIDEKNIDLTGYTE